MGEENKPAASFLARKNAGGNPPPAPAVPSAPPPPAAPPPPSMPAMAIPAGPSALFKPKSPSAINAIPAAAPPPVSQIRSATMQSGKLMIPSAKAAQSNTATGIQKMSAIRPSFSPGGAAAPTAPGKGTLSPNNIMRSGVQNVSAFVSGAVPVLPQVPAAPVPNMAQTAAMGPSIQQLRQQEAQEMPTASFEPARRGFGGESPRAQAEQILQRGLDHYDRSEHDAALAAYNDAIQVDPTFAMAYNNMGMVLIDLERYQDAMTALYESIRRDASYGEAYNNLGFVLRRLGNNVEAASAYRQFLDLEPDVEEGQRINGWIESVLAENGLDETPPLNLPEPVDVSGQFQRPQHQQPEVPKIKKMAAWEAAAGDMQTAAPVNELGEISDGQAGAAQPNYAPQKTAISPALIKLATQQVPTLPKSLPTPANSRTPFSLEEQNRQVALIEKSLDEFAAGNLDEAHKLATEAVAMCSKTSEAHTALGKILVRQEKLKEGIEQLELAIQLAPLDPAPHYVLGFTLRAMERNVEAAEIYETYLRLMPDAIDAPKMRQWIMHVKGIAEADTSPAHEDEGFVDYDPIISETDKVYQAALERFQKCTATQTIDDCQRILAEAPDHVRTRILLGRAYMRDGEFEKASDAFEQALDLQPMCAEALYFLGQSFEKAGNSPKALKAYRRYCEENPDGPRVEKLRAWFLAHGVAETGKGLSKQIQCEWCLRFFDESEISLHETKTTCNGCLTLMGSTPIQDANKLEAFDSQEAPDAAKAKKPKKSLLTRLVFLGAGTAAALVVLGIFTKLLDPYLKLVDPYLKMAGIVRKVPITDVNFGTQLRTAKVNAPALPEVDGDGAAVTTPANATATKPAPVVNIHFDNSKVKIINAPEKDSAVFSRWTWKPELAGVEELDQYTGWKMVPYIKNQPQGMTVEGDTIVWTAESKDFEALKAGEKFTVDLTIKGIWVGPEGAQRDLFVTTKTFTVSSQFGYDIGPEVDIGMKPEARNIGLLGVDADGDGMRDMIVTHGSLNQGAVKTVFCGADGSKQSVTLAENGRYSSACAFPLNGKENAGVLAANWQTGEIKLFLLKDGRLQAGSMVKLAPGIVSLAAMEVGKNKTAIGALSSTAGVMSMVVYEQEKGFGAPMSVAVTGGGGSGHVVAWNSADLGPGFLAVTPLAEEPLRFLPYAKGEWDKAGTAIRSGLKEEGVITAAAQVNGSQPGSHRLALVLGGKVSRLVMLEEKAGRFTQVGAKTTLPGPGLGMAVCDFNKDGVDDLFVVTRDEVCFYFLNDAGNAVAGPRFPNPGMLGPVVLLGFGNNARPDIAVLNENKKARIFKPVGQDRGGNGGQKATQVVAPVEATHVVGLVK